MQGGLTNQSSGYNLLIMIMQVCEVHVKGKDHHCVWLDMCISSSNINLFMMFLAVTIVTSAHLCLMLTSYACPGDR